MSQYRKSIRRYIAMRKMFAASGRELERDYMAHEYRRNLVPTQFIGGGVHR